MFHKIFTRLPVEQRVPSSILEQPGLAVIQICHHFHERTQHTLGGWGLRAAIRLKKISFMVHCDFEKGSQNQHFQSMLFVGMSTLCTLFIMLTILDDHLFSVLS